MVDRNIATGACRRGLLLCLGAVAGVVLAGCGKPVVVVERMVTGATDVTFFVAADTHFGFGGIAALNRRQVRAMNDLPGQAYPPAIGGKVARCRGVLIAGDLTNHGLLSQWRQFVAHYGLTGKDGLLKYPVYEGTGNHDRDVPLIRPAVLGAARRHGHLPYSWDWDDVHLVNLDLCPGPGNLRWLRRDLAKVGHKAPVIIYFHYPLSGPYSDWWPQRQKEAFRKAIDGYNVIGIFHGHFHHSEHYRWAGYDVYNVGSPRHGTHSFAVVHITDGWMTVASWGWDTPGPGGVTGWRRHHVKRIGERRGAMNGRPVAPERGAYNCTGARGGGPDSRGTSE